MSKAILLACATMMLALDVAAGPPQGPAPSGPAAQAGATERAPPDGESAADWAQVAALEVARQDMVETQLADMIARFADLVRDLASNKDVGADVSRIAAGLADRLTAVKQVRVGHARRLIDEASGLSGPSSGKAAGPAAGARERLAEARRQIELAARELGSLLLQAGVSQACEVFATELREIIARQESCQAAGVGRQVSGAGPATPDARPPIPDPAVAAAQTELADRVEKLLADIRALRDSPADALAAVRLARARKVIEAGGAVVEMRQAALDLARHLPSAARTGGPTSAGAPNSDASGSGTPPADRQAKALKGLRQGLLKLRPDARLEELVRARNLLRDLSDAQKALRTNLAILTDDTLAAQQEALKLRQEAVVRPLRQLDGSLEIEAPLNLADQAGQDAAAAIGSGQAAKAVAAQTRVEAALGSAIDRLNDQIARIAALGETHQRMLEAADRLKALIEIRDQADQIRNAALEAVTGPGAERKDNGLAGPANAWRQLAQDIDAFAAHLPSTSRFVGALRRPLRKSSQSLTKAADATRGASGNSAAGLEAAMPELLKAEQTLKEALDVAKKELSVLEKLWLFRQASADIKLIRLTVEDVTAEQADLRAEVQATQTEGRTALDLTGPQAMLARAAGQVQESVAAIREAALMKEPLDAAAAAMNQAAESLGKDQPAPALEAQAKAVAALHDSRKAATSLINQIDLIVIEIDAAAELGSRAMDLLGRQIALRETTEEAPPTDAAELGRLAGEQDILLAETVVMSGLTVAPKAAAGFKRAGEEMTAAIKELKAVARDPAVEHQKKAEDALRAGILALDEYIASLLAILESPTGIVQQYQTAFDGLTAILLLATEQRELRELTQRSPDLMLPTYADKQTELHDRAVVVSRMPNVFTLAPGSRITGYEHIEAAAKAMERAVGTLKTPNKSETIPHQQLAEKELRIAFAMNVVEMIMAMTPAVPGVQPTEPSIIEMMTDVPVPVSLDHWMEFSKADPSGKLAQGGKSEWSSLVDRERAALNENFARELPLEFRKLLKDYYEALAK